MSASLRIRPEVQADYGAVFDLDVAAFGGDGEARMVGRIRSSAGFDPRLSLVAEREGRIVGHVVLSGIVIQTPDRDVPALALAPVAVLPAFQRMGIGSALIRAALTAAASIGYGAVIVLGHPEYFPRFGCVPASAYGITASFSVPDRAFMALELVEGALDGIEGKVVYPAAFDEVASFVSPPSKSEK
ncbi:MAG TPA: N-acetyltransferase [Methanofollis liminatans]|mgnify:CR=1 FL=1|uniref:N-acetyltransferase n=1 Tax=Methanofollis liminatans TaxID=2201 RepID=A0A831PLJ2_9EURY|nr:N-acetyltransferase [Methanofollis liminatans]